VQVRWLHGLALLLVTALPGACAWFQGSASAAWSQCGEGPGAAAWQQAREALARRDDTAALAALRQTVAACPDFVRGHRGYQDCAQRIGGEPLREMLAFYRALPSDTSPVAAYAKARLLATSYDQGQALQEILTREPAFAWAHLSKGRLSRRQGQLVQAIDSFESALAADPSLHEAVLERAQVLVEVGREEEAAVAYEDYLRRVGDDDVGKRAFLSLLLYQLGRIDRALELLADLEQRAPNDLDLRMDRAAAQWRARDPRAAIGTYLSVLSADPQHARAALNIGLLYYEVLARTPTERIAFWPKARLAFRRFLATSAGLDTDEEFERTFAVPYRLEVIAELLGPDPAPAGEAVDLDALRL
jgi:tetratricopeptide (TPR) repeat protein